MLLFHKMGTLIDLIGLSKIFFPAADAYDAAAAIVVTGTEEGKEIVFTTAESSIFQCLPPMMAIFP